MGNQVFQSEDQIVASLLSATAKTSDETGAPQEKVTALFGKRQPNGGITEPEARRLAALARPGICLRTKEVNDEAEIALGATKFGGRPDLPSSASWPIRPAYPDAAGRQSRIRSLALPPIGLPGASTDVRPGSLSNDLAQMIRIVGEPFPLEFICQVDFEEMRRAGPLDPDFPESGLLSVFYDTLDMPWGFDPADHVGSAFLFHERASDATSRLDTPSEFASVERYAPMAPVACSGHGCLMPLPVETAVFSDLGLTQGQEESYRHWYWDESDSDGSDEPDLNRHLVGGWPLPIQGDMQTECALVAVGHYCGDDTVYRAPETAEVRATAKEWVLLLQIGFDEDAGMMWGDVGNLYIWIRREDLVARRFEAARIVLQCS